MNPFKNLLTTLPPEVFRDLKVRLVLLGVFGASVALAWWSIDRLPEWEKKLQVETTKIAGLEAEIDQLERRWNPEEAAQTTNRFAEAQAQLMTKDEITAWQAELKRRTTQLPLQITTGGTNTQDCPLPGKRFSITSATIDLRAIPQGLRTNSPYVRLLNLAQDVASPKKRVDLIELSASGSSNSVSDARMSLQLWSLESAP